MKVLKRDFFGKDTIEVARKLLGKVLVRKAGSKFIKGRIVETEAYLGSNDPASHAACGKTSRNSIMFGKPGLVYVYLCYGNHFLFNIVTEREGAAGAVLVRALEPIAGCLGKRTDGPGKLTKAFKIGILHNGMDLTEKKELYVNDDGFRSFRIGTTGRIGISKGTKKPFRFFIKDNVFVSCRRVK
jgi:DNA-3-methyladenine glycosylase